MEKGAAESYNSTENIHVIMSRKEKTTDDRIVISTWQSIYKMDPNYFDQFDVVIGDEAHLYKSISFTKIMEKLIITKFRFSCDIGILFSLKNKAAFFARV